jgi:HSP20 family protein
MANRVPAANEFVSLREAMDRLVNESFVGTPFRNFWPVASSSNGSTRMALPLDVFSTQDEVVVIAAVPGLHPDDVEVTINQNTITLSGQLRDVAAAEGAKSATWYVHELPSGEFQRTITVPVEINASKADAIFKHGILRLTLPKAEQAKPKQIKVRMVEPEPIAVKSSQTD